MKSYKLSFGTIILLSDNMVEVIVDDGIEMDLTQIEEYHDFLLKNLKAPFSILINKKHAYSYTFKAQMVIGKLDEIKATAVLIASSGALMSAETLININKGNNWNIKMFQKREEALSWLEQQ